MTAARRAARTRTGKPRSLDEVLAYKNPKVIWRFQDKFALAARDAKDLFRETLRWLWACATSRALGGPALHIRHSMTLLDEMWHEFILFTQDYTEFCDRYLGGYIHHQPATRLEKQAFRRGYRRHPARMREQEEASLVEQFRFLRDHVGERVLEKWIRGYRAKYTPARINELRIPY
ncbi:MAG TPA: hypothetical protein VFK02_05115 [Kofleriaceae bacterium]|nr:hypothetical protein [Kofleriaceae bacterium]